MVRIDRICIYILMLGILLIIPSSQYITFLDEICSTLLMGVALADCLFNNNWKRYKLLWLLIGVMTFYAVYSFTAVHFNIPKAIVLDWLIEMKPFIPFIVFFCVNPRLTAKDKAIIRKLCLFNGYFMGLSFLFGVKFIELLVFHVTYGGNTIFICSIFYIYCSIDSEGHLPKKTLYNTIIMLTFGLLCTRSKYFATYLLILYFLYIYKPGMMRHLTTKHLIVMLVLGAGVIAVAWNKISFYFLTGNSGTFDPTVVESFARPVLYTTGFFILFDYFPFGTGLGSFATHASAKYYSDVYYEYGIDKVHGLAPNMDFSFICDAFYPSLAQFGFVGLILFICFWVYSYNHLRYFIRSNPEKYRYPFIVGALIVIFILIESVASTIFTHNYGIFSMMLYGMLCARGREEKEKVVQAIERSRQEQQKLIKVKI